MRRFREHVVRPCAELREHVDALVVVTPEASNDGPAPWRILPEASGNLILHVFRPSARTTADARFSFVGPRSVFANIDRRDRELSIAVRFRPGAASAWLGVPMGEFCDRSVPAEALLGEDAARLRERSVELVRAGDIRSCLSDIERTLVRNMRASVSPIVASVVRQVRAAGGRGSVADLAAGLGVTARHLRNLVTEHVGLSPKRFARVTRVNHALRRAELQSRDAALDWAALALEMGYYDQPHLIADFRELMGETPAAFFARENREPAR